MLDERLIHGLHVDAADLAGSNVEGRVHEVFQTSTVAALLDGAFDGDLSFAELARHGDLGLGTLNGLDGEMIALDGRFLRADADGHVTEIDPSAETPFAVVTRFSPTVAFDVDGPLDHHELVKQINRTSSTCATSRARSSASASRTMPRASSCRASTSTSSTPRASAAATSCTAVRAASMSRSITPAGSTWSCRRA